MSRKSVLMCVLTLLTVAYVAFAVPVCWRMADMAKLTGMEIEITGNTVFVSTEDICRDFSLDGNDLTRELIDGFDLYGLEHRLSASDKIQEANVNILTNGKLRIRVKPMEPVARVFDEDHGTSYYINRQGKKISAELRYHIDVPVVTGHFDSIHPAERLLPLLDYISQTPRDGVLVGSVCQEAGGNIIIVPTVVGHIVNFGDTSNVVNKFQRLRTFYHKVLPSVGWTHYDTIAVKWRGQIVASRRHRAVVAPQLPTTEEIAGVYDEVSESSMIVPDSADFDTYNPEISDTP